MQKDKYNTDTFTKIVKDLYYQARKERLDALREEIKFRNETLYDFNVSMDKLVTELLETNL